MPDCLLTKACIIRVYGGRTLLATENNLCASGRRQALRNTISLFPFVCTKFSTYPSRSELVIGRSPVGERNRAKTATEWIPPPSNEKKSRGELLVPKHWWCPTGSDNQTALCTWWRRCSGRASRRFSRRWSRRRSTLGFAATFLAILWRGRRRRGSDPGRWWCLLRRGCRDRRRSLGLRPGGRCACIVFSTTEHRVCILVEFCMNSVSNGEVAVLVDQRVRHTYTQVDCCSKCTNLFKPQESTVHGNCWRGVCTRISAPNRHETVIAGETTPSGSSSFIEA